MSLLKKLAFGSLAAMVVASYKNRKQASAALQNPVETPKLPRGRAAAGTSEGKDSKAKLAMNPKAKPRAKPKAASTAAKSKRRPKTRAKRTTATAR